MHHSPYRHLTVIPLAGGLGAEVLGIELVNVDDDVFSEIKRAFVEYGVIFFRDQQLKSRQFIDFANRFGKININRFFKAVDGYPQIAEVKKEPGHTKNIGGGWHTDHSYDQIPALGSMLYAKEVPDSGGDTLFSSMYLAYDALSEGMKRFLAGLSAKHSSRHVFGPEQYKGTNEFADRLGNAELATQDAYHPVVITHPLSGRKALYVNPGFTVGIDGWSAGESAALLGYLFEHAAKAQFTCRFRWKENSMAFWDNRATWHYAVNDYPGKRRYMHRITIEGSAVGA